jgi:hypothetical protein
MSLLKAWLTVDCHIKSVRHIYIEAALKIRKWHLSIILPFLQFSNCANASFANAITR